MNLPNVFQNTKMRDPNNSQELFYGEKNTHILNKPNNKIDINKKIKDIFSSTSYVYKMDVTITTKSKIFDTTIIGKSQSYLITLNNELINIKDIIDINAKN